MASTSKTRRTLLAGVAGLMGSAAIKGNAATAALTPRAAEWGGKGACTGIDGWFYGAEDIGTGLIGYVVPKPLKRHIKVSATLITRMHIVAIHITLPDFDAMFCPR